MLVNFLSSVFGIIIANNIERKKRTMNKNLIGIAFAMLFFVSCSSIYIPSAPNTPLLESKGEKQVELGASTNSAFVIGSYAFSDKYAFMLNANMSYGNFTNYYDLETYKFENSEKTGLEVIPEGEFNHQYYEAGIGRYNFIQTDFKIECFAGAGYGVATDHYYERDYKADYLKAFIQANIGSTKGFFDYGGSIRFSNSFYAYQIKQSTENYRTKFSSVHLEPSGFVRIGTEQLKFVARVGFSLVLPLGSFPDVEKRGIKRGAMDNTFLHLSLGAHYKF